MDQYKEKMMEKLLLVVVLIYVFAIGYEARCKHGTFVCGNVAKSTASHK